MTNHTFDDVDLGAAALANSNPAQDDYLVVCNQFTAALYSRRVAGAWTLIGSGAFGSHSLSAVTSGKKKNLYWIETEEVNPATVDVVSVSCMPTTKTALSGWIKQAINKTTGRGTEPNSKVKHEVGCVAGWHCQFEGCGENLRTHTIPGVEGNFSYYAHIIASSADGPRGDPIESPRRSTDPTNLMLLCDKCHKLIDRVAPHKYPADRLFQMRENNIRQVQSLLEKLKFKGAQMIAVTQPIQGQGAGFDERLAEEAMWQSQLRKSSRDCLHFMQTGNVSSSNQSVYWLNFFHTLKTDLPVLKRRIDGIDGNTGRPDHIALFPLHGTSVLVATGRILGEASTVSLFQFTRDQVGGNQGGQWSWPNMPRPDDSKFVLNIHKSASHHESEALLMVFLTAKIPFTQLPPQFQTSGHLRIPTVEVTLDAPSRSSIAHPYDLELFGKVLDTAYAKIQDEWQIGKVHLIVIAPTTACVRVGQKMQARSQSEFILYERDSDDAFKQTISITGTNIVHSATGESVDIS